MFSPATEKRCRKNIVTGVKQSDNVKKALGFENGNNSGCNLDINIAYFLLGNQRESKNLMHWTVFLFPFHTTQSVRDKTAGLA